MPSRLAVRAMRTAISPRLAMRTEENMPKSYPKAAPKSTAPVPVVLRRLLLLGVRIERKRRRAVGRLLRGRPARGRHVEQPVFHVGAQLLVVVDQPEGIARVRRAAVAHAEHLRGKPVTIGRDGTAQPGDRGFVALIAPRGVFMRVGEQRKPGRQ